MNHLISGAPDDVLTGAGGLSGEDLGLSSLLRRFGPVTGSGVVRWTAMRPTTVSTLVRRLQQRGHVEQRPHPRWASARVLSVVCCTSRQPRRPESLMAHWNIAAPSPRLR